MSTPLPQAVKPLIDAYIAALERDLPGLMNAMYLHGSLALDAFVPRFSDVDFITVLNRRPDEAEVKKLAAIHYEIAAAYPRPVMQGSYLQAGDLGRFENDIEPSPCYSDGILNPHGHNDINAVTWWLLKNKGITVSGTPAQALDFSVDWGGLVADMRLNLNSYWVKFTRVPARMIWLLYDDGIQWAVLGVLRQFYTFCENDITSKTGAGEYALQHLPKHWQKIVREALNIRNQTGGSLYRLKLLRAVDAFRFLRFIIGQCNNQPA